jgi:hypothetical protein
VYGRNRVVANLIWTGDFQSVAQQNPGGKGFGGKDATQFDYLTAFQGALCAGPIAGVPNIWASNGRLTIEGAAETYTVPSGGGSYTVANASLYAFDQGTASAQAYSVTANDYGSPGPVTMSGTQQVPLELVTGTPGAGQYSQSSGVYTFSAADAGQTITISYNFSLYVLEEQEDYLIPNTGPYEVTVQYQPYFKEDFGVIFVDTGVALTVGSGPGQYTVSSGNYFFNAANFGRPIAISYSWDNSQYATDPTATLQIAVLEGTQGQAPWSYMTSKHLSQALGYSGIALVCSPALDCGPSATIPQYNYEVIGPYSQGGGIQDANPADCITDILTNPLFGAGFPSEYLGSTQLAQCRTYWAAASFFISPVINSQSSCAEIIQTWLDAGNCAAFSSEGLLKILPYGDTTLVGNGSTYTPQTHPVVDLDDDDFLEQDQPSDPVAITRDASEDAYNAVRIQFANRLNSYNEEVVEQWDLAARQKYGQRVEAQQNYDFVCTLTAAQFSASIRLNRIQQIRRKYSFTISGVRYWFLEPMDLVTLTDVDLGLNKTPVRIFEIEENEKGDYQITAEEFPFGATTATLYPKGTNSGLNYPTQAQVGPGNVNAPILFEALDRLTGFNGYELWMGLSGNNPNWGGCHVWLSEDGTNYVQLKNTEGDVAQLGQCRMGVLTAALPAGSSPDSTHTLSVDLRESLGSLQSVTTSQAQQLRSLCYVDNELLAFRTATLTGPNQYNLTYLIRGALGTPNVSHAAGSSFLRLDSQVFAWQFDSSQIGKTIYLKFTSFNLIQQSEQNLADVVAYPYTITGNFQGAISHNGGAYIGGSGSAAITFNTDFTYTNTPTSITVGGSITLYLSNLGLSSISIPVNETVSGLSSGTEYWLFPFAIQDTYGNWSVMWVVSGMNGITGGTGTPAIAFAATTSPVLGQTALAQYYTTGAFTPLSQNGLNVTTPTSGTGGGTGGGIPNPVCLHEDMLVDELALGTITAKHLWELYESGEEKLFLRDGTDWIKVDAVYRAECRSWCKLWFANGEEALTTEGHWWLNDKGALVTSDELEGHQVECDEGFTRCEKVEFDAFKGHFVRLVLRGKRKMHNVGTFKTSLHTHNWNTA